MVVSGNLYDSTTMLSSLETYSFMKKVKKMQAGQTGLSPTRHQPNQSNLAVRKFVVVYHAWATIVPHFTVSRPANPSRTPPNTAGTCHMVTRSMTCPFG